MKNTFRLIRQLKCFAICMAFFSVLLAIPVNAEIKLQSGWVEKVAIVNAKFLLRAKIDTGARHSSIHAKDYRVFKKQGKDWIGFSITNKEGDRATIEKPIIRYTNIKQKNNRPSKQRPVIILGICLGNVYKEVEVNLVDRANFNYPMLVGRSFLAGSFLVDSESRFLTTPSCKL